MYFIEATTNSQYLDNACFLKILLSRKETCMVLWINFYPRKISGKLLKDSVKVHRKWQISVPSTSSFMPRAQWFSNFSSPAAAFIDLHWFMNLQIHYFKMFWLTCQKLLGACQKLWCILLDIVSKISLIWKTLIAYM